MKIFSSLTDPELVKLLKNGAVGVLPTDTVYGLVGSASNEETVNRIFTVKKRDQKPGTIIAANIEQLSAVGLKARYLKAVEHFWPNSISVLIPHTPNYLSQGLTSVAVRIPNHPELITLLEQVGALMTTSANAPNQPTSTNIAAAQAYFGDSVDFYVDAGELGERPPSTVIRIVDDAIEVLRQGAVQINESGRISA